MVHIERLVCKGFKSFGRDTVTIKFSPGFTCIVGPNGSGKSNVVDAILFVLGQLSAKTLRATVFSDLLYSPPKPGMPPKATKASVELHFNNKDRKLQVDADRVVIERELDDSGTSTCRINSKTVTRSAVLDILGTIGVDPNGYNLVLQGEIAQMVKVSPAERRSLIEEIAGISAYDDQKERALKKLAESETNLGKVETQLQERRRQLEKLELERMDALRYNKVRDKIKELAIDRLAWTVVKSQNRVVTINETLSERAEEAESLSRELEDVERGISTTDEEIEIIDNEIDRIAGSDSTKVSEQFGLASAAVDHVRDDLEREKGKLEEERKKANQIKQELEEIGSQIESTKSDIEEKQHVKEKLDKEIESTSAQIARMEDRFEREQASYYETTQRLQDLNNQMRSLDEGVSEIRSAIKSDNKELGLAYEGLRDAKEDLERTEGELIELNELIPRKKQALNEAKALQEERTATLANVKNRLKNINSEANETAKIVSDTREELIRIQARQDALRDAEEAFLKRKKAVARVLELRDSESLQGIYGTVAELGTIDPDYSVALEIAGGGRLTHVVVEDDDVASQCIDILKRERVGRASFIPLNKIRTRKHGNLPERDGVVSYAIDLVSFDDHLKPAFQFVFSDTIVTRDFETAKHLGFSGRRAVSLDGDLVERSGLVTGGYYQRTNTGLALQVEDKSPEIAHKLQGLENILNKLRSQQDELRKKRKSLEKEIETLSRENYRGEIEVNQLEERREEKIVRQDVLRDKISSTETTIRELENQIEELRERDQELSEHRETVRLLRDEANEALVKSDAAQISHDIKDLKEVLGQYKREEAVLNEELTSLRVALEERLEPKSTELELRLQSLMAVLPGLEEEVERLQKEYTSKENELEKLRAERSEIEDAVKDKRVKQLDLKEKLRNLRLRHEEIREEQTANEKSVYRLQTEQSRLESDIVAFAAELQNLGDAETELNARQEKEELTYREIEELEDKIKELEREQEAMGAVNLKALEDYEIEKRKYNEIVEKKTRLEEEHKEILAFMEEIEAEKTRKFLQVYNEIADNFSKVFAKLSPGGEATLMLENAEHPLMGGITVRSKPRGKDLVTLDAMSGGEKTLTGLALIFAIQMYNPTSFYIFDEIDAALDDVNAHNVAMLISEMSKSSQFIVVSLRDTTVRKADILVGVSNQDGISRIVTVDLEEAAESA